MKKNFPRASFALSFFSLSFFALFFLMTAHPAFADAVAHMQSAQGGVDAREAKGAAWTPAKSGDPLGAGAAVKTAAVSRAGIVFENGVLLRLNELSLVELASVASQAPLKIDSGKAYFFSRDVREFPEIETPIVSASIRGTEFVVSVQPDTVRISVLHGAVEAHNTAGSVLLRDGEEAVTVRGQAPVKQILVKPLDAVQWALYYPAVLSVSDFPEFSTGATQGQQAGFAAIDSGDFTAAAQAFTGQSWRDAAGRSLIAYRSGDTAKAFNELPSASGKEGVSFTLYRAALYLSAGQVEKAEALLATAQAAIPSQPDALRGKTEASLAALKAMIAVAKNQTAEANALSERAVSQAPGSAGALLARSYAQQANFDLRSALDSASQAARLQPDNPAVRAREAELLLGFGKVNEAGSSLSGTGDTEDSRLLSVKGFAALTENEIDSARDFFERAIARDSESGTPFLGRGLAKIRRGDLEGGRSDIEQAVMREPSNALFRSYLGKAFFEEERNGAADEELAIAKKLDPLDPTPYLYGAYNKLSEFRPIEALDDIEESIDRNDNRAVYRSRLLLDQDLAVRSIGLSQIYNQLGFEQAGREEAIKSIQQDYSNYSAHLLLAGAYSNQGSKLAQASLSEFFLSQLLAPRDFVFFSNDQSNAAASFNEYASLFDRNRYRTNIFGSHETGRGATTGGATQAGTFDKWSYIVSYESEYVDGYRSNDWSRDNTVFGRAQYQPSFDTSLSASTLFAEIDGGDDDITFDINGTDPDLSDNLTTFIQQLGFRHQIEPGFLWIAQGIFSHDRDVVDNDKVADPFFLTIAQNGEPIFAGLQSVLTDRRDRKVFDTYRFDTQLIRDTDLVSVVAGAGVTGTHIDFSDTGEINPAEPTFMNEVFRLNSEVTKSELFARAYGYSTWHAARWLDLNLGGSFVHLRYNNIFAPPYEENTRQIDRFNPKAGASAYLTKDTILRAAYFQNLGAISLSEVGDIEPTLIGGFNQNSLDVPGVRSENYGIGLSHKFAKSTYLGTEFLVRDLDREVNLGLHGVFANVDTGELLRANASDTFGFPAQEKVLRTYISQLFSKTVAGSLKHTWSSLDQSLIQDGMPAAGNRDTNEFSADLNYFDRSGLTFRGEVAWRLQHLDGFGENEGPVASDGTQDFWLLNAGVTYQLPRRYGTIGLVFRNILDEEFQYIPTDLSPDILPVRSVAFVFSATF